MPERADAGPYSANLFYNLGNAYFRTGNFGRAILNYERALALDRHHPESEANLRVVRDEARALERTGCFAVVLEAIPARVAARITDYARPGEVLVSDAAVTASDPADVRFVEVGPVDLKGIAEPVRLFSARREST